MSDKLSVIISVGKAPGLQPPLPGAYTGHDEFKAWALSQGHDIVEFTDRQGATFNAVDIARKIEPKTSNQSLSELWIYYAGHGECSSLQNDYWILKRAAALPSDVIDVTATRRLATLLGIPRVIIVGDACRTTGDLQSMAAQENATSILPARNVTAITPSVECLFATQPGSPALEAREANAKAHGVFTSVLMTALRGDEPSVKTRSDDGKKLVVRLRELRLYLEERVPSEAARLGKGRAQMPNILPGGSTEPYAVVGIVPDLEVRITTVKEDGTPADGTSIRLSMLTGPTELKEMGTQQGPSATFTVPSGCVYESTATGPYESLVPESPLPLFRLDSPKQGCFRVIEHLVTDDIDLVRAPLRILAREEIQGFPLLEEMLVPGIDVVVTRVIANDGRLHHKAPTEGVYPVVTYDALTGETASHLQRFTQANLTPTPVSTRSDQGIVQQIVRNARVHGRHGFETRTGLTLIGQPEAGKPEVASPPGALDDVFFEDGNWHVRGTHSAAMLIRLGENYLTGAVFRELVGTLRLSKAPRIGMVTEDLSYVPVSDSRHVSDLTALDRTFSDSPRDEIDALQLIASHCARNGFFEVTIDDSVGLAGRMRQLKHENPVFGVLAAYAYEMAGRKDQIIDMIRWFIRKEQSIPFDLVMLSDLSEDALCDLIATTEMNSNGQIAQRLGAWVVPTWPILTQGWSRLSDDHLKRFPVLKDVQASLVPGFWAAASGKAGKQFFESVQEGKLRWI